MKLTIALYDSPSCVVVASIVLSLSPRERLNDIELIDVNIIFTYPTYFNAKF